jgi:hypothetical protein
MEAPPPYMPPPRKSNTGLIVGLIIGGVFLCCLLPVGLLVGGGLWFANKAFPLASCSIAYEDARDAIRAYADDHNGNLPAAATWQDDVRPYYQKIIKQHKELGPIKLMPADGAWGCDADKNMRTGMAFNDDLAGKKFSDFAMSRDVLLYEIKQATMNAHGKYVPLPESDAPQIVFGQPRGWFIIRATGSPLLLEKGMEKPAPISTPR